MWAHDSYRKHSPGEGLVDTAIEHFGPAGSVIDFGCGTGRAAMLFQERGFDVIALDLASNCLDPGVTVSFTGCCLWDMPDIHADYGFCTDVMEHVPEEMVDAVLDGIRERTKKAFFQIATSKDGFGPKLIGEPLHVTVRPADWWIVRLEDRWTVEANVRGTGFTAACG